MKASVHLFYSLERKYFRTLHNSARTLDIKENYKTYHIELLKAENAIKLVKNEIYFFYINVHLPLV